MKALEAYAIAKKYIDKSLDGAGALKGAPCEIQSIVEIPGGHRITFSWKGDSGTVYTDTMNVKDGLGIKSVAIQEVDEEYHLIITFDDDTTEDAGKLPGGGTIIEYPELVAPSATISGTGDKVLERGSTANVTITVAFDRGEISPAYSTSGYRSGAATGYRLNSGTQQPSGTFSVTVSDANKSFVATVAYAEGEQPKDSEGNDYDSPLPAGAVSTQPLVYEFVNAIWANASDITTVAKQPLVSVSDGEIVINFAPQTILNPEEFHIPTALSVNGIYVQNPFSESWEEISREFDVSTTTHTDASGSTVNYRKYVDNRGYGATGRTIKVTWA